MVGTHDKTMDLGLCSLFFFNGKSTPSAVLSSKAEHFLREIWFNFLSYTILHDVGKATSALKAFSKSPPFSKRIFSACILGISNS